MVARTSCNITLCVINYIVFLRYRKDFYKMIENSTNMKQQMLHNMPVYAIILTLVIWNSNQQYYVALFCHVWSVCLYNIFSPTLLQTERHSEFCTEYKAEVWIFTKILYENSPILRNIQQGVIIIL